MTIVYLRIQYSSNHRRDASSWRYLSRGLSHPVRVEVLVAALALELALEDEPTKSRT